MEKGGRNQNIKLGKNRQTSTRHVMSAQMQEALAHFGSVLWGHDANGSAEGPGNGQPGLCPLLRLCIVEVEGRALRVCRDSALSLLAAPWRDPGVSDQVSTFRRILVANQGHNSHEIQDVAPPSPSFTAF